MSLTHRDLGIDPLERLAGRIREKEAVVGVVGLGYVGLPLLLGAAEAGFPVMGVDTDPGRVASLRAGRSFLTDVADSEVAGIHGAPFSADPRVLEAAEVILIAVPTPLTDHAPDLSAVREACAAIAAVLAPGRLVVLESTTYPGTTEEEVRPILETSGLAVGRDVGLAYSPERIDPGSAGRGLATTPKVLAGLTERCRELAVSFYSQLCLEVVVVSTPREAEMAKLIENTFRQVNIALVNELSILARELGVDIWEALSAAATKPFGYLGFWPGPGVGGHCIGIDPTYLSWRAGQATGTRLGFIEHANEVNHRMPDYVVSRIAEALNDAGKPIRGSKVLGVGAAYKPGVADLRGSPALAVLERLARRGAEVCYHDPHVPSLELAGRELSSVELAPEVLAAQDCVAILTAHAGLDHRALLRVAPLVFDARGVTAGIQAPNLVRL